MLETELPVPASETEVTKEWLQSALADTFPVATFAALKAERIGADYGFASRIFRVQWLDNDYPQSVIVKLWDTDSKAGIGEVLFYRTFKDVGARIPMCFYSAANEETQKAVLVLEDLSYADQGDVHQLLDSERASAFAFSLAKMHATWLNHPQLTELSWLTSVSTWAPENGWFESRRALFLERFPERLDGLARLLLDKIEFAPQIANERLANAPTTLLHGDFHLDNVLFVGQTPVLLDWSRPLKGPPVLNLANLLFGMISLDKFDTVLDFYIDAFNKFAEIPLSRDDLEKQLGGILLQIFSSATCGMARWNPILPRAIAMIDDGIKQVTLLVEFWQKRDPELFTFLG